MKRLMTLSLLGMLSLNALAIEVETIEIVQPIIPLHEAVIRSDDDFRESGGALVEAKPAGSFQSTFYSKEKCIAWAKTSVSTLLKSNKVIYSANCTNKELAPYWLNAGHFVGYVSYL